MKFFTIFSAVLLCTIVCLQWRLWLAKQGGVLSNRQLEAKVAQQEELNTALRAENKRLLAEISDLKRDLSMIEAKARTELGMIKEGETFYRLVE